MPPRLPIPWREAARGANLIFVRNISMQPTSIRPASINNEHVSVASTPSLPITQPDVNSHRRPDFRKSQLHRQYTSVLRSNPLILVFQHNSISANEWIAIRKQLDGAMEAVDEAESTSYSSRIKLQVVRKGILASALKVVEYFNTQGLQDVQYLSREAWEAPRKAMARHGFESLITGPIALLTIPSLSPAHLKAALAILSPSPAFPAPRRRVNPAYHEPDVQSGLAKLLLLGARVDGNTFDIDNVRWLGGIEGGLEGLRARLVSMLQSVAGSVTSTLTASSRVVLLNLTSRQHSMEQEAKEQ